MVKRACAAGAVVGLMTLSAGSVAPAASADGDDGDTIRVVEVIVEEAFVDNGKSGPSLGDQFVFSSNLLKHGEKVGHAGVACTIVSVEHEESQCLATAWFDDHGQITVQGLVAEAEGSDRFAFAITGGTGDFSDAAGELIVKPVSNTRDRLIFKLES
jgi:hypothetical protein